MAGVPPFAEAFNKYGQTPISIPETAEGISHALAATLDPLSPHEYREQARQYLDVIKDRFDAPRFGFALASDPNANDAARYWGLQAIEHAIKYKWSSYESAQTDLIREWVVTLADHVGAADRTFIRNKVAQLWAEAAKRCWGDEWMDMDKMLVAIWEKPKEEVGFSAKLLVVYIVETLNEDVINGEDAIAGLRAEVLGNAVNDIMVPMELYMEFQRTRSERIDVRYGDDGWLSRLCALVGWCLRQMRESSDPQYVAKVSECAVKTLRAMRPTMQWINLKGPMEVTMVGCLSMAFHVNDVVVHTAAVELLYALLSRPYSQPSHDAWHTIMQQALLPETTALIKNRFETIQVSPGEDDEKYLLQKKLSELISVLADAVALRPELIRGDTDMPTFFQLLKSVLENKSLVVSIPVLHSWTKILTSGNAELGNYIVREIGQSLVQTCSARLLRYESLSEADADRDDIVQFLFDDFDTMPERHAFLGNYRRYCLGVIRSVTRQMPKAALDHVLGTMRTMLEEGPYTFGRGFDSATYSKSQLPLLQMDAQFQVLTSALKGYAQWLLDVAATSPDEDPSEPENERNATMSQLQQWCYGITNIHIDNPEVADLVLSTLVMILRTIKPEPAFVLHIVQHLLTMQLYDNSAHEEFSAAVKNFEVLRVIELQKLAIAYPNELLEVYHQLEPRILVLLEKHSGDPRLEWGYRGFLCSIIHRATNIEHSVRMSRLEEMLKPVYEAWSSQQLTKNSLWDLEAFCGRLDLASLEGFYTNYGFKNTADWSSAQLDEAGIARQNSIKKELDGLPLRMTKCMLIATTDEIKPGTDAWETASVLWGNLMQTILEPLMKMVKYAQEFHNMERFRYFNDADRAVHRRTLQDRFWQSGISSESKEEFYARISGSKTSFEGFASVVRGTMRNIREQGFHIIYLLSKLDEQFFCIFQMEDRLAEALFTDAGWLSPNHLEPLISLTMGLVKRCPPRHRGRFFPPLLRAMFVKLDAKITAEWAAIDRTNENQASAGQDDELGDEMRLESVLRQLTYSMVQFIDFLLSFDATAPAPLNPKPDDKYEKPAMRRVVLHDIGVLESMMVFCAHVLRVRDIRCVSSIVKIFRTLLPLFVSGKSATNTSQAREFVSTEVLQACITSLHEPYFADVQRDLASLIAQIILLYAKMTPTPRAVLMSLHNIDATKVDKTIAKIEKSQSERQQRSLVLELLEGIRGVSIHEAGKIAREQVPKGKKVSGLAAKYMEIEQAPKVVEGEEVGLESLGTMFGEG